MRIKSKYNILSMSCIINDPKILWLKITIVLLMILQVRNASSESGPFLLHMFAAENAQLDLEDPA